MVSEKTFPLALSLLETSDTYVIDVETSGLDPFYLNRICGVGVGLLGEGLFYFPFFHKQGENLPESTLPLLMRVLNNAKTLIGYNIKFDIHFLMKEGLNPWDKQLVDTIVLVRLTEIGKWPDLSLAGTIERSYGKEHRAYDDNTHAEIRKKHWLGDFSQAPPELLGPYCMQDVFWTRRIYKDRLSLVVGSKQEGVWQTEQEVTKTLLRMESRGMKIDEQYCAQIYERINGRKKELEGQIFSLAHKEFLIASNPAVGQAFKMLGVESPCVSEKTGKPSWNESALIQLNHPLAGKIREWRTLAKAQNTYLEPNFGRPVLHTSYLSWGCETGRLSSRNPNAQNIPRYSLLLREKKMDSDEEQRLRGRVAAILRSKGTVRIDKEELDELDLSGWGFLGGEEKYRDDPDILSVRRLLIPRDGYKLLTFDYSQMEVRVFLSYLKNPMYQEWMLDRKFDFHSMVAQTAFGAKPGTSDFKFYRQMAKTITFGLFYGLGVKRLAVQLDISEDEAKDYKNKYFAKLPGAKQFIYLVQDTVKRRGYIFNRFGRVYHLPPEKAYTGVDYLVQGTSADIMKIAMLKVDRYLQDKGAHLGFQIHDELIGEYPEAAYLPLARGTKRLLEENTLGIPLYVDVSICEPSWAHKKDLDLAETV